MKAPWTAAEAGPVPADLARRFPGTTTWRGEFTGNWWALVRDRAGTFHLVEAATPAALVRRLDHLGVRRATPPTGPAPAPRYSRALLVATPDATVPDPAHVRPAALATVRTSGERHHRAPRRGRWRAAFSGRVAS